MVTYETIEDKLKKTSWYIQGRSIPDLKVVSLKTAIDAVKEARREVVHIDEDNILWWKNKFEELREKIETYRIWINFMINNSPYFPGQRDALGQALDKYHQTFGETSK